MSIPPKWLLFLCCVWFVTLFFCAITVGKQPMDTEAAGLLSGTSVITGNSELGTATAMWTTLTSVFQFGHSNMSFFNDGIGSYIRAFLILVSFVVGGSVLFDVIRLLKPLG